MTSSKKNEKEEITTEKKEPEEEDVILPIDSIENKKVDLEKNIQPKDSNTFPVSKDSVDIKKIKEPIPHNS